MAFDGSGTFNRPVSDYVFDTPISETDMNTEMDGIATGLSTAIAKDGQTTITANLPMAGFRHTGVGNAGARNDYAAAGQVQDGALRNGGVAGGTADALTLTLSPALVGYVARQKFRFTSGAAPNTGAATVNVNALGAKAIEKAGTALAAGDIEASTVYEIVYDGTAFQIGQPLTLATVTDTIGTTETIANIVNVQDGEVATGTTVVPLDDTIPQITEGDEYMTLAITPTSATSKLKIDIVFQGAMSAAGLLAVALFQDATANALAVARETIDASNSRSSISFTHWMTSGTTSSTTFRVRAGPNAAATVTFNGGSGSRNFGGVLASSITITEIRV